MAEPITWRNIGGPNFGGVAQQGNVALNSIGQGFNALAGVADKVREQVLLEEEKQRQLTTAKLIQERQSAQTIDEFNANRGNFDIAALEQRLGAGKFDAEAFLNAESALPQAIMQRQQLGNQLQQEALAAEAAPLLLRWLVDLQ